MEAAKSSNCCVVCAKSYFEKKDCTNDFEFFLVIVWAMDVDDVICEGCKRGLSKSANKLDSNLLSCHCFLKLSLII